MICVMIIVMSRSTRFDFFGVLENQKLASMNGAPEGRDAAGVDDKRCVQGRLYEYNVRIKFS